MPARILIVDDNQSLAKNLRDVLEGDPELGFGAQGAEGDPKPQGYDGVEVALAETGAEALERARQDGFEVAVVDVKLPDGSGVDLIGPLREACPHGEIVLVTGNATVNTAIAALRAGAFAFILKNFRPAELISTVAQALEKVALKREREEFERRYRAIVDAADVLIVGIDAAGNVTLWNPRLAAMTGVSTEAALGGAVPDNILDEDGKKRFYQAFVAVRGGGSASEVEVGVRDAMGAIRRVRWHLSAVRGSGKRIDLVYGIGIDVTERRALERRAADAEALNAMAPLALGLAHEIRNPLNAAVLELHLLARGIERLDAPAARDPMRARVRIVESEIKRLERLLTDFLELARPRAPQREPLDLGRVVDEVLDLEAWLSIGDTGPGVDPNILAEIFDPFFTTKAAGTGLGLAIVRKIVDQHGGRIVVDTKKGEGTTVKVILPRG